MSLSLAGLADAATVSVTILVDDASNAPVFTVHMAGKRVALSAGESATDPGAPADAYRFSVPPVPGFGLMQMACTREADGSDVPWEVERATRSILIAPGEDAIVNCTLSFDAREAAAAVGRVPAPGACAVDASQLVPASEQAGRELSPCDFMIPAVWSVRIVQDDLLVSVIAEAPCASDCRIPTAITMSIALGPNPNAEAREAAWPDILPVAGSGRCGDGDLRFFSTSQQGSLNGGLRFHVPWEGLRYDGSVTFSCSVADGWLPLQALFLDSFRSNPGTTFPRH